MIKYDVVFPVSITADGKQTFGREKVTDIRFDDMGEESCKDKNGKERSLRSTGAILLRSAELFDRDGKEIYQGDLLQDDEELEYQVVVFNGSLAAIPVNGLEGFDIPRFMEDSFTRKCKVVANVFENPVIENPFNDNENANETSIAA